jgi:hypothetical protein
VSRENFRRLLLLYVALIVAEIAVAIFAPTGYSDALSEAFENEPQPMLLDNLGLLVALGLPVGVAAIAGLVGLYLFKAWGRVLSLVATIAELVVLIFTGPALYGAAEYMLWEASTLVWGAILALAYYSPVAIHFERPKQWSESTVES